MHHAAAKPRPTLTVPVTLKLPPEKLREVNVVLENTVWGHYRPDFYPTYDYKQLAEQQKQMMRARR